MFYHAYLHYFPQPHFPVICEYPIILVLPIYFFTFLFLFYSWEVFACLICFAISCLRNVAFDKRLWNGAPDYPNGVCQGACSVCVLICFLSVLIFGWERKQRTGWEKGLLSVNWAFPTSDTFLTIFLPHGFCTGATLKICPKCKIRFNF